MKNISKFSGRSLIIYVLLSIAAGILSVSIAWIIELTINVVSAGWADRMIRIMIGTLIFLMMYGIFYYMRSYYMRKMINDHVRKLRSGLFQKIFSCSYSGFREAPVSDYLSALTNDIQVYQEGYLKSRLLMIQNVISAVIVICALLYTNVGIAFLVIVFTVFICAVSKCFENKIYAAQRDTVKGLSLLTQKINNDLEGFYVINTYHYQHRAMEIFSSINTAYNKKKLFLDKNISKSEILSMTLSVAAELTILFVSANLVLGGRLSMGEMVAVMQLTGAFVQPLMNIMTNLPQISGGKAIEDRFLRILKIQDRNMEKENPNVPAVYLQKEICCEGICFSYKENGQEILHNINLQIEKGKKYAIVGQSGAGKSTLMNVLNGVYQQNAGEIQVDGRRVKNTDQSYVDLFATVGQNTFLFNSTVKENILLDKPEKKDYLEQVCSVSGAVDLIKNLEHGMDEVIQDNGANLSGGQKQKIALARALYHNKPVLILDEGTSAIDKNSAYEIENKLLELQDVTLISITHDVNPVQLKKYDEIICMDRGEIKAAGRYEELFAKEAE